MIIESSTFRIKDDYGIIIEVKPVIEIPTEEASKEIAAFFERYRIVTAYKEINPIDKKKLVLAIPEKKVDNLVDEKVRPAKRLSMKELVYIVKRLLPAQFGMGDFINYMNSKEEYDGYTFEDKKEMWKSVHAHLLRNKKIELLNKGERKTKYRYRYIGIDEPKDDTDLKISSLKNGEIVKL